MQRAARVWGVPFGIGVGAGLVAGLVGVAQWVLTLRDLAQQLADFQAAQRKFPGFFDETSFVRNNEWYWFGTATLAGVAMLVLCWLAAFTASRVQQHVRDGMMAALVTAVVSSAMYVAATPLAVANSPAPDITQSVVGCEPILGVVFFPAALLLARVGTGIGARAGMSLSRGRRAV